MSVDTIRLKITTLSNLFIGGSPGTFEIGGIDLYTVTDYNGHPYLPASSFKGNLKKIVRDLVLADTNNVNAKSIGQAYEKYLLAVQQEIIPRLEDMKKDERSKMEERFEKAIKGATAEYLFGIEGFNHTPKLIFNDLRYVDTGNEPFSLDSKNTIQTIESSERPQIAAKPRTYRTVRPGVEFVGEIHLYMLDKLSVPHDVMTQFIEDAIQQFNTGIYRLGNSGSRGYGRIQVEVSREGEQID